MPKEKSKSHSRVRVTPASSSARRVHRGIDAGGSKAGEEVNPGRYQALANDFKRLFIFTPYQ